MLPRVFLIFSPELSLYCLNSNPVPRKIGQVVCEIKNIVLFPEIFLFSESKITGLSLFEQSSFS